MLNNTKLRQGDLKLLEGKVAQDLLASTVPARLAYVAADGTPRVLPTWFHWTGDELVMATFVAAPHMRRAAARLKALQANPNVAVTIETSPSQLIRKAFPQTCSSCGARYRLLKCKA